MSPRDELAAIFRAALDGAHAGRAVERALDSLAPRDWHVIAAGKAAVPMARAAAARLGSSLRGGLVVTREGHGAAVPGLDLVCAGHPVPDARSVAAGEAALARADALGADDALLFLLSGGASALLAAPVRGVTLEDVQHVTQALLERDVDIAAINAVRRQLSRIKGGGLARAAAPAQVVTLAVSDVAEDRPEAIGSGPTVPDPTTRADALEVLRRAGLEEAIPAAVRIHLLAQDASAEAAPGFPAGEYRVVAALRDAIAAAVSDAERRGLRTRVLGRVLDVRVEEAARRLAGELERARAEGIDLLVAGGEPTVEVRGPGKGGRAQQLALEFACLARGPHCTLVAGTDGSDGPTDAAGAVVDSETCARGAGDPRVALARNDCYPFLASADALLITGPTGTNVNDLALVRVVR